MNVITIKKSEKLRMKKMVEEGFVPFAVDIAHVWLWKKDK